MLNAGPAKPRLAVVISHATQHFAPLYARIAKSCELDLNVFFVAENGVKSYRDKEFDIELEWDVALTDGYQHEFVEPGKILKEFSFLSVDSAKMIPALERFKPDFIWVHGYAQRVNWRVVLRRPNSAQIIYSSDSNLQDPRSNLRYRLKSLAVSFFFRRCDHFLSISPANRKYLKHYGAPESSIVDSVFPIDMQRIILQRDAILPADRHQLRVEFNIPEAAPIALFAGKLVTHKRPQDLIAALSKQGLENCYALFVGSGAMQDELSSLAQQLSVAQRCRFVGFVNQNELAKYFSIANLFVFTSEKEPYGAMAAELLPFALPMVVADTVGAVGASVYDGQNACLYPVGDQHALAQAIRRLITDPELIEEYSKASLKLATAHDNSHMARDIIRLCRAGAHPPTSTD